MVQKRRGRTLRGGLDAQLRVVPAVHGLVDAPAARRGRDRVVALGAVATLATVAGIAGWRLIEGDPDAAWATQAQAQLASVDQQLALLAQTTDVWKAQPAAVTAQRPDAAAVLLQREQELDQRRDDLTAQLAQYQQLPALRAREAADADRAEAMRRQLDASSPGVTDRTQLTAALAAIRQQRQQDAVAARTAADAVAAAKAERVPDDSDKTAQVLGVVQPLIQHQSSPPAPARDVPPATEFEAQAPPAPADDQPRRPRIEAPPPAVPGLLPGAFAAAGGQPAAAPGVPAPGTTSPTGPLGPTAPAGMPLGSAPVVPSTPVPPVTPHVSAPTSTHSSAPVVPHVPAPASPHSPPPVRPRDPDRAPHTHSGPGHDDSDALAGQNRAPALPAQPEVSAPQSGTTSGGKDDAPVSDHSSPTIEQPAALQPAPQRLAQQQPAAQQPAVQRERPELAPEQDSRGSEDQSVPASVPQEQIPARETTEQPRVASSRSLPSEADVERYTGDKEIARQSQTPEGQALMRSMFGTEDSDSSTASDRASVRRDPPSSSHSDSDTGTKAKASPDSRSHKRRTADDSATAPGSSTSSEPSSSGNSDTDERSTSDSSQSEDADTGTDHSDKASSFEDSTDKKAPAKKKPHSGTKGSDTEGSDSQDSESRDSDKGSNKKDSASSSSSNGSEDDSGSSDG